MFEILKNLFSKNDKNQLVQLVKDGALLVDVRSPGEFASGNVRGSINIPVDQIQDHLQRFMNQDSIIVFCKSGMRSSQAKSILEKNGFSNVTNGGTWENIKQIINS